MVYQNYTQIPDTSLLLIEGKYTHLNAITDISDTPAAGCTTKVTVTGSATCQIITESPVFRLFTNKNTYRHLKKKKDLKGM